MCQILARVNSLSRGNRSDVFPRDEGKFSLSIIPGGHGVCSYVLGWTCTLLFIHSKGADTQDATMRLGIREGMMYRVLGQPVVGSKGILDRRLDQSATEVVGGSSSS
jgi:hypothetical protein